MRSDLSLAEEVILLFTDNKGLMPWHRTIGFYMGLAIEGAVIYELVQLGRIRIDSEGIVTLNDASPTGDAVLDKFIATIKEWLAKYPSKSLLSRTLSNYLYDNRYLGWGCSTFLHDRMVDKKILRKIPRRWLWLFPRRPLYIIVDERVASKLKKRIADYILQPQQSDEHLNRLIGLVAGTTGYEEAKKFIDTDVVTSAVNTAYLWTQTEESL